MNGCVLCINIEFEAFPNIEQYMYNKAYGIFFEDDHLA